MRRSTIALSWVAVLLLTRAADAAVTFQYSPDLAHEANPVVRGFGGGWGALLVLNAVLLVGTFSLLALWWRRPLTDAPNVGSDSFWAFASRCRYGRVYSRGQFLARYLCNWRLPRHFLRELGFVIPPAVSLLSLVSILDWYLLFGVKAAWFWSFFRAATPWYPYIIPAIPLYFVLSLLFYRFEWVQARRELHDA
jgi:hypothetical protein